MREIVALEGADVGDAGSGAVGISGVTSGRSGTIVGETGSEDGVVPVGSVVVPPIGRPDGAAEGRAGVGVAEGAGVASGSDPGLEPEVGVDGLTGATSVGTGVTSVTGGGTGTGVAGTASTVAIAPLE